MLVIPAIDIKNGNCVRLLQGRSDKETVYSARPAEMALKWVNAGAERIHIVDLDGAFTGAPVNTEIILYIRKKVDVCIEVGGGIRELSSIDLMLDAGIDRVILGTSVVSDRQVLASALKKWPGRVIAGLDAVNGKLATRGWTNISEHDLIDTALEIEDAGVEEFIITDINTDGMLSGPNTRLIKDVCGALHSSVIASGGVSSEDDILALRDIGASNLYGVITGKALYDGRIELEKAIEALRTA